jgi:hypothetical protein
MEAAASEDACGGGDDAFPRQLLLRLPNRDNERYFK